MLARIEDNKQILDCNNPFGGTDHHNSKNKIIGEHLRDKIKHTVNILQNLIIQNSRNSTRQ